MKWISATVNEEYIGEHEEGLDKITEGNLVILNEDGTWYRC